MVVWIANCIVIRLYSKTLKIQVDSQIRFGCIRHLPVLESKQVSQ